LSRLRVPKNIESLKPYPPGKPIKELERELGVSGAIKLASNESPFGPPPGAVKAIEASLSELNRYPDGSGYYLKQKLASHLDQPPERIVLGCGTNEILDLICRIFVGPGHKAVLPHPTFLVYQKFLQAVGAEAVLTPLKEMTVDLGALSRAVDDRTRLVVVCNPNNPTGTALSLAQISRFVADLPDDLVVLIDEAYLDFVRDPEVGSGLSLVSVDKNLVVTRTFSKIYGLAGLRIGFGVMSEAMASYLNRVRQPFNVTSPALAAAEAALDDQDFLSRVKERAWAGLDFLKQGLSDLGLEVVPSQTNFLLFKVPGRAEVVYQEMMKRGVIIRHMASFGLDDYLRVSVGTETENRTFLSELGRLVAEIEK